MSGARPRPVTIQVFPNGEVGIVWDDGTETYASARRLRAACPCATCVDELTGERRLDPSSLPGDLAVTSWTPVGRYAVAFRWTDGHDTGIFDFGRLRDISESSG